MFHFFHKWERVWVKAVNPHDSILENWSLGSEGVLEKQVCKICGDQRYFLRQPPHFVDEIGSDFVELYLNIDDVPE